MDEALQLRAKGVDEYNNENFERAKEYFEEAYDVAEDYELKEQLEQDIRDCDYYILRDEAYEEFNNGVRYYDMRWERYAIECFERAKDIFGHLEPSFARECDENIELCEDLLYGDDEEEL